MTASGLTIAAIMGAMLLVFIFSGYYLFAALGGAAIISGLIFWGPNVFQTIYFSVFKYCKDYNLLAVPLFVLMGQLLNQSGVAGRLFDNLSVALGRQRGGMAIAATLMITFVATNLIAGIAGSSSAGLVLAAPVLQQAATMTNAAVFHRTTVLASLGLDSLPNAGFLQTECTVAGVKFKDVYFPVIFALTVVLTILRCLLYMGLAAAFGIA